VAKGAVHAKTALAEPANDIRTRFTEHGRADFIITVVLMDDDNVEVAKFNAEWSSRASVKRA